MTLTMDPPITETIERSGTEYEQQKDEASSQKAPSRVVYSSLSRYNKTIEDSDEPEEEKTFVARSQPIEPQETITRKYRAMKHTLAYLRYRKQPELRKLMNYAEHLRDTVGTIDAARYVSLMKEILTGLWVYSPEVDINFAKILTLLEDALYQNRWKNLSRGQMSQILDVIKITQQNEITHQDQRKAFKLLYTHGIDTFPNLEDGEE